MQPENQTTLEEQVRASLMRGIEVEMMARIAGNASTAVIANPGPPLDPEKLLRDMGRFMREWRRTDVTVTVVLGHLGPPTITQHPTDGQFIECDYRHAAEMHKQVPMILHRILDPDRAEFKVAGPFGYVSMMLPAPPYKVPADGFR